MIPTHVRVKHDPEAGTYGDCLRACIASIMEREPETIPHFAFDGCNGATQIARLRDYLAADGLTVSVFVFPGEASRSELLAWMGDLNPNTTYVLCGATATGVDHAVIAQGGKITHDPSWYPTGVVGPASSGVWQLMVITKL